MEGYIKLYRKLLDSPTFDNPNLLKVFVWCLLKATHCEHEQVVGLQTVTLNPGQFIFGRDRASEELHMNPSSVYKYIQFLQGIGNINIKSNNKFSLVTVANWEFYQDDVEKSNSNSNNKVTQTRSNIFIKPTVEEVNSYCIERKNNIDGQSFIDFYDSKGWVVGKSPMKNWQAAVRTWERSRGGESNGRSAGGKNSISKTDGGNKAPSRWGNLGGTECI